MGCTTHPQPILRCPECGDNVNLSDSRCCTSFMQTMLNLYPCQCKSNYFSQCDHCEYLTEYIEGHSAQYELFLANCQKYYYMEKQDPIQERKRRHDIVLSTPSVHFVLRSVNPWSNCALERKDVTVLNGIKKWHERIPEAIACNDNDSSWYHYLSNLLPQWLQPSRLGQAKPIAILMDFFDTVVSRVKPFFTAGGWVFDKMRTTLEKMYNVILSPLLSTVTKAVRDAIGGLMILGVVLLSLFEIVTAMVMFKVLGLLYPEMKETFTHLMAEPRDRLHDKVAASLNLEEQPTSINGDSMGFLPFAVSLVGVMFCLSAGSPTLKTVSDRMRVLNGVTTAGVIVNNLASYLWYVLPVGIKTCLVEKFGSKQAKTEQNFEDWQLKAETLLIMSKSPLALSNTTYQSTLEEVTAQYSEFDLTVLPRVVANKGTNILFKLLHVGSILYNIRNQKKERPIPFSVHLAGAPGSGKSVTIRKIKEALGCKQSYAIPKGDDFWSGCPASVDFIVWDEFLVGTTNEEYVKNAARVYLDLVSCQPFQPPLASTEDPGVGIKGTYIAPRVVVTSNNTLYNKIEGHRDGALARRRNWIINTRISPNAKMKPHSSCNVDLSQYTEEEKDELVFVDYYIYPAEQVNNSAVIKCEPKKLKEILAFLESEYVNHMTSMIGLLPVPDDDEEFSFQDAWDRATASVMNLPKNDSSILSNILDSSVKSVLDKAVTEVNCNTPKFKDVFILGSERQSVVAVCENWHSKGKKFFSFPTIVTGTQSPINVIYEMFLEKYSLSQTPMTSFECLCSIETSKQTVRYHLVKRKIKFDQGYPKTENGDVISDGIYYTDYFYDSKTKPFGEQENFVLTKAARECESIIRENLEKVQAIFECTDYIEPFATIHSEEGQDEKEETVSYTSCLTNLNDSPLSNYDHHGINSALLHSHRCITPNCPETKEFIGNNCPQWTCSQCSSVEDDEENEFFVDDLEAHKQYSIFRAVQNTTPKETAKMLREKINRTSDFSLIPTYALIMTANTMAVKEKVPTPWWSVALEVGLSLMTLVITMFWVKKTMYACLGWNNPENDQPMFINGESKGSQGGEGKTRKSNLFKRWSKPFQKKNPVTEINSETSNNKVRMYLPGGDGINLLSVCNGWVICHGHWWYEHYFNNKVEVTVQQGTRKPFQYVLNPDNMVFMDTNDLIMINIIHPHWQKAKDSTSKFMTDLEWSERDGLITCFTDKRGVAHSGRATYRKDYTYISKERTYTCEFALVANYVSVPGNCGLPVYATDSHLFGKIVGLVVSGSIEHRLCGVSVVTQEMIKTAMQGHFEIPEHQTYINSNFVTKNVVPKSQMVKIPRKTKLEPSDLVPYIGLTPQKQPAVLTDDDPRMSEGNKGPIVNAIERLGNNPQAPLNMNVFRRVINEQRENYTKNLYDWENRELTMDEAVKGIPGKLSSIDLTTSPGYPWVLRKPGVHKNHWITIEQDGSVTYRYGIETAIQEAYEEIRSGIKPLDSRWIGYMKDELVSQQKIEEGRTRIIYTGNFVHTIAFRMLYGGVMLRFNNTTTGTPLCIQQNQFSQDMNNIYVHLTSNGNNRFSAGDYKHFDQKMQRTFQEAAYDLFLDFAPSSVPTAAHTVFKDVQMDSPMQIDDVLLRVQSTHFSGCLLTTLINCFVNEMYFMYIFYTQFPKYDFYHEIRLKVMGDDNLFSSSNRVTFNAVTMAENAHLIGQVYTSDVKNQPVVPYKKFEELTFCGAHPRLLPNGKYTGAMRKSTLEESTLWTRNNNATLASECIQMIEYASQWDQDYYSDYKKRTEHSLYQAGWRLEPTCDDFEYVQTIVSERTTNSGQSYGKMYINSENSTDLAIDPVTKTAVDGALGLAGAIMGTIALFVARRVYKKVQTYLTESDPTGPNEDNVSLPEMPSVIEISDEPIDPERINKTTYVNMGLPTDQMQTVLVGTQNPDTTITLDRESQVGSESVGQSEASQEALMSSNVLRDQITWKNSHAVGEIIGTWNLPGDLIRKGDNKSYQTRNFTFYQQWRGTIVITVTICAPTTAVGAVCLSYAKMQAIPSKVSVMNVTTRPHVMVPAVTGTEVYSLRIPFDYYLDYFPLGVGYTKEQTSMGQLTLSVYGAFADLTFNETTVSIFSSFQDNCFLLTRTPKLFTHGGNISTSNYNYDMHDIGGTVTTQTRGTTEQKSSNTLDTVLPLDKPIVAGGSIPHFIKNLSYSNTDGPDVSNIMSTRRCHLEMEHFKYETNEGDIAQILMLPTTLFTHTIEKQTALGDLFTIPLTTAYTENFGELSRYHRLPSHTGRTNAQYHIKVIEVPLQTAVLGQFEFWRGDFVFRFIAIKNPAHSFTIRVTYMPNIYSLTGEEKECYCNAYLKFTGDSSVFDVKIPWKSPHPFLHTFDNTGCLTANSTDAHWTEALKDQSLGLMTVELVSPLVASSIVPEKIGLVVQTWMTDAMVSEPKPNDAYGFTSPMSIKKQSVGPSSALYCHFQDTNDDKNADSVFQSGSIHVSPMINSPPSRNKLTSQDLTKAERAARDQLRPAQALKYYVKLNNEIMLRTEINVVLEFLKRQSLDGPVIVPKVEVCKTHPFLISVTGLNKAPLFKAYVEDKTSYWKGVVMTATEYSISLETHGEVDPKRPSENLIKIYTDDNNGKILAYRCTVCATTMTNDNEYHQHLGSNKHRRKVEMKEFMATNPGATKRNESVDPVSEKQPTVPLPAIEPSITTPEVLTEKQKIEQRFQQFLKTLPKEIVEQVQPVQSERPHNLPNLTELFDEKESEEEQDKDEPATHDQSVSDNQDLEQKSLDFTALTLQEDKNPQYSFEGSIATIISMSNTAVRAQLHAILKDPMWNYELWIGSSQPRVIHFSLEITPIPPLSYHMIRNLLCTKLQSCNLWYYSVQLPVTIVNCEPPSKQEEGHNMTEETSMSMGEPSKIQQPKSYNIYPHKPMVAPVVNIQELNRRYTFLSSDDSRRVTGFHSSLTWETVPAADFSKDDFMALMKPGAWARKATTIKMYHLGAYGILPHFYRCMAGSLTFRFKVLHKAKPSHPTIVVRMPSIGELHPDKSEHLALIDTTVTNFMNAVSEGPSRVHVAFTDISPMPHNINRITRPVHLLGNYGDGGCPTNSNAPYEIFTATNDPLVEECSITVPLIHIARRFPMYLDQRKTLGSLSVISFSSSAAVVASVAAADDFTYSSFVSPDSCWLNTFKYAKVSTATRVGKSNRIPFTSGGMNLNYQ